MGEIIKPWYCLALDVWMPFAKKKEPSNSVTWDDGVTQLTTLVAERLNFIIPILN